MVFDGILDINTQNDKFDNIAKLKTALRYKFDDSGGSEVIVAPLYNSDMLIKGRIPGYRNTLYWNPEVLTGTEGTLEVSFYTSDDTDIFDIIVEGISYNGQAGYEKFQIKVGRQSD